MFSALWYTAGPAHTPVAAPLWLQLAVVLALLRYAPSTVAGPLLVNAVVTSVLTIYLCNLSAVPSVFFLIGAFVCLAVGRLLCRFCGSGSASTATTFSDIFGVIFGLISIIRPQRATTTRSAVTPV